MSIVQTVLATTEERSAVAVHRQVVEILDVLLMTQTVTTNRKIQKTVGRLLSDRVAHVPLVTQTVPTNWAEDRGDSTVAERVEWAEQVPQEQITLHHRLSSWTEQGTCRCVSQRQEPTIQKSHKTVETLLVQFLGEVDS